MAYDKAFKALKALHSSLEFIMSTTATLGLYRALLRAGQEFSAYQFKMHAQRRVRAAFKANMGETNPENISALHSKAADALDLIRRQAIVQNLYTKRKVVLEM